MTPQQRVAFKALSAAVDTLEAAEQKMADDQPAIAAAKKAWDNAVAATDPARQAYYAALIQGNVVDLQAISEAQTALSNAKIAFNNAPGPPILT